jgi:hypothetical protein
MCCRVSTAAESQRQKRPAPPTASLENTPKTVQALPVAPGSRVLTGQLKLESMQYPTRIPGNAQLNSDSNLIGNFKLQKREGLRAMLDVTASNSINHSTSHLAVSEAYLGWSGDGEKVQLLAGRKLEYWSLADSDWQLGQWQPTFSQIDALKPIDQGLSGFFWRQSSGQHELLSFLTPMFVPSMGPDVQEKDGALVSDSRWYRQPSPTFAYQGVVTRVVYNLDLPDTEKLVRNPGAGLRYKYGGTSPGFWFGLNGGYKPINSLPLRYRVNLKIPVIDPRGEVTVAPLVEYHSIGGGDIGYRFKNGMVALSLLADRPESKLPEDKWFQQQPRSFFAQAFHSEADLDVPFLAEDLRVSFNYLRVNGGGISDVDSQGEDQGALFESRFNFTNAASVKADVRGYLLRKRVVSSFKYMREFAQKGTLIGAEFSVFPTTRWALNAGLDILGVDQVEANRDAAFLNQFRANDRYYGGMSYVF